VSDASFTDIAHRKLHPKEIVPLFRDNPDNLTNCLMTSLGVYDSKIDDNNINAYLNFTVPFKIGDFISGNIKFGGLNRTKSRLRDDKSGGQATLAGLNQFLPQILADSLGWIVRDANNNITANGLTDGRIDKFLGGQFNFGNTFSLERLNQISDLWERRSEYYYAQGPEVYLPLFGEVTKLGYTQNVAGTMMNDQNIKDRYLAGYFMSEINFGKYIMFLPGVRFENTHSVMNGFYAMPLQYAPPLNAPLPGSDTSAVRSDRFLLPMVHLRVKPTESFYMHFAYTQTLSRPDFNVITPNYYVNTGIAPFSYSSNNPTIRPELWTNLDAQFVFHGKKIGLFSVNAFYKTVKDKLWGRSYQRIKGDAIIEPFPNTAVVNVYTIENHSYKGYVRGLEVDWQTSFNFLPKPFNYLTLSANYTFTNSVTSYPYTRIDLITPTGGGRPVAVRVDSVITGPMYNQPDHIANVSLGYNKNGFNAWLSYQYNGGIYTGKNFRATPRLDTLKDYFYRWDLQITQKFAIKKRSGFEVLLNIANFSNFTETQHLAGDIRPTYQEQYGWTADMGLRFKF
jgi:TonB-dependent receptor